MMTEREFSIFIKLKMPELAKIVSTMGNDQVMHLKYDFQQAIANYSKGKQGKFDKIQEKALAMMMKLEKWIKAAFIKRQVEYLKKVSPSLTKYGIKELSNSNWEKYNSKMSY